MPTANLLRRVDGYVTGEAFQQLMLDLNILDIVDTQYERAGSRGATYALIQLPSLAVTTNQFGIGINPTARNYVERTTALVTNTAIHTDFAVSDTQMATFDLKGGGSWNVNAKAHVAELVTKINADVTQGISLGGDRWLGDPTLGTIGSNALPITYNASLTSLRKNIDRFLNYGGYGRLHCVLPSIVMSTIAATGYQQFTGGVNDYSKRRGWSLPGLEINNGFKNVKFYSSDQLSTVFEAGTVAQNQTLGYNIVSVVDSTSVIPGTSTSVPTSLVTISGVANGETVIVGDLFDITKQPGTTSAPLKLLQRYGHQASYSNPQARVITGGTVAGGQVTFEVSPALKFSTPVAPEDNLTRAIITTPASEDQVRFVKPHLAGFVMMEGYAKFAAPALPTTEPYYNKVVEKNGVSMRTWYGYDTNRGNTIMAHDVLYGFLPVSEGIARIPFSPTLLDA